MPFVCLAAPNNSRTRSCEWLANVYSDDSLSPSSALGQHTMTRIWTIQPAQVWERLRKKQSLYVEEKSEGYRGYIPRSYRWLQWQLYSRLPEYSGHMPWWAHCGKPDLRRYRHTRQAGTIEVRLELEIADK